MDYTQITAEDRQQMCAAIGINDVDALLTSLPASCRLDRPLAIPEAMSELSLQRSLGTLTGANRTTSDAICFMGAGAYDHFIPSVVDHMASGGEFVTAYTPYQAEASQGSLQAFFEFQTQISRLTGMDVANASLYEGASAIAEAIFMAINVTGKRRILIASTLHPHYQQVIQTSCADLPVTCVVLPAGDDGCIAVETVKAAIDDDTACVVVQSPNVYGLIEAWKPIFETTHEQAKTLAVAVMNPIACALLKTPGDCGADIAVGEGQPLGIPMMYGGPWLGLFAAKKALMRKMPGRLIGQTTDSEGRRGFCLTLQTREQHIRGAKATSNVCTNQGLLAVRATIYLSTLGPDGLREVAEQAYHKAHYAAEQIAALPGYTLAYPEAPFFHEFVVNTPVPAEKILAHGRDRLVSLMPGVDLSTLGIGQANQLLVTVTEKRTEEEIQALVACLKEVVA